MAKTLFDPPEKELLKVDQCYFCRTWTLEERLSLVSIPDQAGRVKKPICKGCLNQIMGESRGQDEAGQAISEG